MLGSRRLGVAALGVLGVVAPSSTAMADDGHLIDVGDGRRMYLECHGEGGPTVVFESGWPNDGTVWTQPGILQEVSGFTRACIYDRPGTAYNDHFSRSDAAPQPRTAADVVSDLHTMLQRSGEPGPYVFVAHSIGGLFVRLYATTYPDDVAGLVLVDVSHEDQVNELLPVVPPDLVDTVLLGSEHPSPDVVSAYPQIERILFQPSGDQVRAAQASSPLRPMPLVVLTHGIPTSAEMEVPANFPGPAIEATVSQLQRSLTQLVPGGRHVIASRSGHYVQLAEPELVVDAAHDVVDAVRRHQTRADATEQPQTGSRTLVVVAVLASIVVAAGLVLLATARRARRARRVGVI